MKRALLALAVGGVLGACGVAQPTTSPTSEPGRPVVAPSVRASVTSRPVVSIVPKPTSAAAPQGATGGTSLVGDTRSSWAFAPVADASRIVVEGSVPSSKAYSTSKVLIVAAFLDTVVGGDPGRLTVVQRDLIRRALRDSDGSAVVTLQNAIPGGIAAAGARILASVGDRTTGVPSSRLGAMQWSVREQVRFMAALGARTLVSAAASDYLLSQMQPAPSMRWGLGTIGASAFKGGWLRSDTETRQMGIVNGYAVAIITAHVGPAVLQADGDVAHVQQMNALAARLQSRLAAR